MIRDIGSNLCIILYRVIFKILCLHGVCGHDTAVEFFISGVCITCRVPLPILMACFTAICRVQHKAVDHYHGKLNYDT